MAKSLRIFALLVACEAFAPGTYYHTRRFTRTLGKKEGDEAETLQAQTLPVGSIVEFDDGKGRFHIGKVRIIIVGQTVCEFVLPKCVPSKNNYFLTPPPNPRITCTI